MFRPAVAIFRINTLKLKKYIQYITDSGEFGVPVMKQEFS
jgi:hypothetical protein